MSDLRGDLSMMARGLHAIVRAVHRSTRAVPVELGVPEIEVELVFEVPPEGGSPVVDAVEENLGLLAGLMPADVVVPIAIEDLRVLLKIADASLGAPSWTEDAIRERGVKTLHGWSLVRSVERRGMGKP